MKGSTPVFSLAYLRTAPIICMTIIETNRLLLRQFNEQDTAFIVELLNSPGWLEFIGDRNIKTENDARNYLVNGPMKSYTENGFGLSMVELKETATPIGMCGLIKRTTLEHVDIGFAFLPGYAGQGYAYEIASATLDYAFKTIGLDKVLAITVVNNEPSIRLLKKIGLRFEKMVQFENEELMLFGINC